MTPRKATSRIFLWMKLFPQPNLWWIPFLVATGNISNNRFVHRQICPSGYCEKIFCSKHYCNLQRSRTENMVKSEPSSCDTFFIRKIKNKDPKMGVQGNNSHIFLQHLWGQNLKKKKFFFDPTNQKFGMHKKNALKIPS